MPLSAHLKAYPGKKDCSALNVDDVISSWLSREAAHLEEVVQEPGGESPSLSSPSCFMLPVPRQFTSKIPQDLPLPLKRYLPS